MKDFVKICLSNSGSATCNIGWTRLQHSKQHCSECILLIAVCKQLPVVLVTMLTCDNYNWRPSQKELVYWAIVLIPGFKREVYTISCSELQQCGYVKKGGITGFEDVLLLKTASTPPASCLPTTQASVQECYAASTCFARCSHRSQPARRAEPC